MDGFKQRVIGALVLISLAVIFIPMLFDEPHEERTSKVLPIPETPPLPSITIEQPKPLELEQQGADIPAPGVEEPPLDASEELPTSDNYTITELPADQPPARSEPAPQAQAPAAPAQPEPKPQPQPVKPAPPQPTPNAGAVAEQPVLNESGLASAWTVQIGTFKNRENAHRLRDKIREQGMKGYTREISTTEGELVRVFAGPVLTNEEALKLKGQVDKALSVNSLVVRYTP